MTEEVKPLKPLSKKHQTFIDNYFIYKQNGTEAYIQTYNPKGGRDSARVMAAELLAKPNVQAEVRARIAEVHTHGDRAIEKISQFAEADMGIFFKVTDDWTFYPHATSEILDEKEVIDDTKDPPVKRISYRVRRIVVDLEKVRDPKYSHLLKSFSESPKSGVKLEIHDPMAANMNILKLEGRFKERIDLSNEDGSLQSIPVDEIARRVSVLVEVAKKRKSNAGK